jgi:broad specificity phosphatase PhoE
MIRLILVRHGRAAHGWEEIDPGLDEVGWQQAAELAATLGPLGPLPLLTSPMRRCRETAGPLAAAWGVDVVVEPAMTELPSPRGVEPAQRPAWLRDALGRTWTDLGPPFLAYRAAVLGFVAGFDKDGVVVSHFIAINAVIGAAVGDDRLVVLSLDNGSRTTVDVGDGRFHLVEGGDEADTLVR